jgi:hypothetical protein
MTVFRDAEPEQNRLVKFYNGERFMEATPSMFVVLKCVELLQVSGREPTVDAVAEMSGAMAEILSGEGWFSWDEYVTDVAREEAVAVDEELQKLTEEGE